MAIKVEVRGDYACFSRPEMSVEKVSYDVMTPSAARGIIESIYWHPGLRWVIDAIHVCAPIRFTNIRRNEVQEVASAWKARQCMENGTADISISTAERTQRATMALRNVHYVIEAHFEITENSNETDNPGKFADIARRRLEKGQTYSQPYLGTREFAASFSKCAEIPECPEELKGEKDLGWMLLDMDYSDKANIKPMFFRAVMVDGVLKVPKADSEGVAR